MDFSSDAFDSPDTPATPVTPEWAGVPGGHEGVNPVLDCVATMREAIKAAAHTDPCFLTARERAVALGDVAVLEAQLVELKLRLVACSDDVAKEEGHRDMASWLAAHLVTDRRYCGWQVRLAEALTTKYPRIATGLREGRFTVDHAKVIVEVLNELVGLASVTPEIMTDAEERLTALAAEFTPSELKRLGRGILEVIDPDLFEDAEKQALDKELAAARAQTRVIFRPRRDGTTDIHARVPDSIATRLKGYLDAWSSPRHDATARHQGAGETAAATGSTDSDRAAGAAGSDAPEGSDGRDAGDLAPGAVGSRFTDPATGKRLPPDRVLGEALCAMLEHIDPTQQPRHGGTATTLVITAQFDALRQRLGPGTLPDGTRISGGELRRLSCNAHILPAILDGPSRVLDLGDGARFFDVSQRIAMAIIHSTCQASGCTVPSAWCEAHHKRPWSHGGHTDLEDGMLLCPWHHQRIHDDSYIVKELPNGGVRFHRRR